jgi:hypothetical protein
LAAVVFVGVAVATMAFFHLHDSQASTTPAPGTYAPGEAVSHMGETKTVEGVVSEVFTSRRGDTFLDFGGRYPNEAFTGVIFRDDAGQFGDVSRLEGRTVDVTGEIKEYRGRPEIILSSREQLQAK